MQVEVGEFTQLKGTIMALYSAFKKIDSAAVVDLEIITADVASQTIQTAKIADGGVTTAKIAPGAITTDKLAASLDISGKTVTYRPIVNSDISSSANIAAGKLQSGAAVANLGYTPVNKSGDTMTGRLNTIAGSASSPAIRGSSDGNTGVYFPSGDNMRFSINGSDAMRIDSSARVTYPQKPAFTAVGRPGWLYSNSYGGTGYRELNSIMNWEVSHQYGGSNFSTGNGRYTAPVAGWYHFSTMWYLLNNSNGTNSYVHLFISRNGDVATTPTGRTPYTINMHGNRNNYDDGANYNSVLYLNAGQYVSLYVRWHANGNSRHHAGHHIFSGHLVG